LQAEIALPAHETLDLAILDGRETRGVEPALGMRAPRLLERRRTQ